MLGGLSSNTRSAENPDLCRAHTYNVCPTAANQLSTASSPFASLGISSPVHDLVPFGNPCDVVVKAPDKSVIGNRKGRIIGYGVDTPGYVVVLESDDGAINATCDIITSVDVVPFRDHRPWVPDGSGASLPAPSEPMSPTWTPLPTPEEARGWISAFFVSSSAEHGGDPTWPLRFSLLPLTSRV